MFFVYNYIESAEPYVAHINHIYAREYIAIEVTIPAVGEIG